MTTSVTHALSVKRVWAKAILAGEKKGENRSWKPPAKWTFPFWIALHVGKQTVPRKDPTLARETALHPRLKLWNKRDPDLCGKIVAVIEITGVEAPSDKPYCGTGPHVWTIGRVRELDNCIPCVGRLGLFALEKPITIN